MRLAVLSQILFIVAVASHRALEKKACDERAAYSLNLVTGFAHHQMYCIESRSRSLETYWCAVTHLHAVRAAAFFPSLLLRSRSVLMHHAKSRLPEGMLKPRDSDKLGITLVRFPAAVV